ncbi:MAG TPA: PAS domain S-box protein [Candidatus Hydrogenedentes bacterium]|nr:PAS domain S-box protein [Candidatus Hydrogenedentota bacterium]
MGRYLLFFAMLALFFLGHLKGEYVDIAVIGMAILLHGSYTHWALWKNRLDFLVSRLNFVLYLVELSVIVLFSGADESPAFVLYILFLIGFSAYRRELRTLLAAAAACCLAFTVVLIIEWRFAGLSRSLGDLIFKQMTLLLAGWFVGNLSQRLRHAEQESHNQAQRVASSEATLRAILDHTGDPILVFDENDLVVDVNESACHYFGRIREALMGQRVRTFVFDDGTLPQKMSVLRHKGQLQGEQLMIGPDGEERAADVLVRSFIRDGKPYYVTLIHDITPQKDLQEATRQANMRLERLTRQLRHLDELRTGFLAAISQKLRSPLSAVLGYIEMLLQEELGDITREQRKALQTCRRGTVRAFRIIDEALVTGHEGDAHKKSAAGDTAPRAVENPERPADARAPAGSPGE